MKLHLLEDLIDQFISSQLKTDHGDWYYPHSMVDRFHLVWKSPDQTTLSEMYDQCLKSEYSQQWWKRDNYRPKETMIILMKTDPELAMIAWKDLANESSSLEGRLFRFNYYCDELLQLHRQQNPRSVETYHQQDASILSLYLAGMIPEKYALYPGLDIFLLFCKAVGSPDMPVIDDLVRYQKVAAIAFTFLQRDKNFEKLIEWRSPETHKVRLIPFQLSYEFILFAGGRYKSILK